MDVPQTALLTDGDARLPTDAMYLHGVTETGEHVSIQIRQSDIPDLENAGRLYFNNQLVDLRSDAEAGVLALLNNAEISDQLDVERLSHRDFLPGPIHGFRGLDGIRRRIIEYLQSDQYVEIATNGVPKPSQPWKWLT